MAFVRKSKLFSNEVKLYLHDLTLLYVADIIHTNFQAYLLFCVC